MPTGQMWKIQSVMTGVAGSPYYVTGYFQAGDSNQQACVDAWSTFLWGATSGGTAGLPSGASVTTGGAVMSVSPVDGQAKAVVQTTPRTVTGTSTAAFLPPATQILYRWRTGAFPAGREVRGRTNLPCQPVGNAALNGSVTNTALGVFDGRAAGLVSNAGVEFVIWSKKNGEWYPATAGSTWAQFSVLRSRRD